jgi:hypothetical protein
MKRQRIPARHLDNAPRQCAGLSGLYTTALCVGNTCGCLGADAIGLTVAKLGNDTMYRRSASLIRYANSQGPHMWVIYRANSCDRYAREGEAATAAEYPAPVLHAPPGQALALRMDRTLAPFASSPDFRGTAGLGTTFSSTSMMASVTARTLPAALLSGCVSQGPLPE